MRCEPLLYKNKEVMAFICPDGIYTIDEVNYEKRGDTYIVTRKK